ncbi:MAG: DUF5060 domain-containing protein [Caldilineaceae bacterium]|nr:DUF5060 domain-containing protein [Caldilineaceae bacterium]
MAQKIGLAMAFFLLMLTLSACAPAVGDAVLHMTRPEDGNPQRFHAVEFDVRSDANVDNTFDPAQMDLQVAYTAPSGAQMSVPAFWYQAYDASTLQPQGEPRWKARFTPTESGEWRAQVIRDGDPVGEALAFTVDESDHLGFVRIDSRNPRYFAFDSGAPYFPIGLNIGWSNGDVLADYERWFDRLSENGGNVARVWMASWSFGIEWNDTGLGNYTNRMKQAWLLDQVFAMAEARGITIMLTLINHGAFSTSVNPEWEQNPYNAALGGPCAVPYEFVTNEAAKEMFKRRLRYIAARWGYSTNLLAWEWWNEVNWVGLVDRDLGPWTEEMTAYIQQFDPYDHLVTTSYADGTRTGIWEIGALDFAQQHDYTGLNPLDTFPLSYERIARTAGNKPIVFGELGFSSGDDENLAGLESIQLHNGLWAAPFTGYASTAMHWWWDNFVDPQDQWRHYKGISTFLQGEDLALLRPRSGSASPGDVDVLVLGDDDHQLLWVRNRAYDVPAANDAYNAAILQAIRSNTTMTSWTYEPDPLTDVQITLTDLPAGEYQVKWFDPQAAEWLSEETVTAADGMVTLMMPTISKDMAAKLRRAR